MSGKINYNASKSGNINNQKHDQNVTLFMAPSAAKSGGSTDHYVVWNNLKSGIATDYASWMSYSGADVTLKPGFYSMTWQCTLDYIGSAGYTNKIFCRPATDGSPGGVISTSYGTASGTHSYIPTLNTTVHCKVDTIVKVATRDNSDGHTHYYGGVVAGQFTFLQIIKYYTPPGIIHSSGTTV